MDEQNLVAVGRVLGKREMLLYIQKACVASGGILTMEQINAYSQVCSVDEMVWQEEINQHAMEIDLDIRHASLQYASK